MSAPQEDAPIERRRYRVGVDIGGTFTDLLVVDDRTGEFAVGKVLTTSRDPSQAVETALREVLRAAAIPIGAVGRLVHGTTLVTNAIIERKGAHTALLASEGFRDSIEIRRETRYDLYDVMLELPRPLVPRYLRFAVPQRTLADGTIARQLDEDYVERLARELAENGVTAVAVSFLHSFTNAEPERAARAALLRAAPELWVSISSEVAPEIREYERTSTTVANVYVQSMVDRYLHELQTRLARLGFDGDFFVMLSSGGIATVDTAARFPIRLLESGPAAGALAAATCGHAAGHPDLLSFDMGGTTAKLCVIEQGQPLIAQNFEVDRVYRFKRGSGLPVRVPVIEMVEIGAGGGSIARVDALGLLKVGPRSAGADPGPACYGLGGTEPTVTDANLVLGYLNPAYFLGGRMKLDIEAARRAIHEHVAAPLGLSLEEAAWGIYQVVNENMANAARVHTMERGMDPQRFPLFAFGGAGPVHGFQLARALGSPALIAPLGAGVMSSLGFLAAPLAFDFVRSWHCLLEDLDWDRANALLRQMEQEGQDLLASAAVPADQISHRRSADMRYVGQGHEVQVPLPNDTAPAGITGALRAAFEHAYRQLYGRPGPPVPVEIINWRVVSSGPKPALRLRAAARDSGQARAVKGSRPAYFPAHEGYVDTPVFDRYALKPGDTLIGPAIVEERESTVIVGPGGQVHIDEQLNLVIVKP